MLILLNKPFNVLCQFTDEKGRATLADYLPVKNVYAAGRLDYDSEGLVILTDSGPLQHRIADPRNKLPKTYLAQVEGVPDEAALDKLRCGVLLKDGKTRPAIVECFVTEPELWDRTPPIRYRKEIPTTWIRLTITEGKNRQVRRMTAAVGLPTLRLVRVRVGPWEIGELKPGEWKEASANGL
ncbi:MAG: pseudouridine synthase [Deltaproteobacteria bacterium]